MKTRSIIFSTLCSLMLGMGLASCIDDTDPMDHANSKPINGTLTLNEGLWGSNNANITASYFDPETGLLLEQKDIYEYANNKKLGDVANALIEGEYCYYVLMNGSKYVARLTEACAEYSRYTFPENEGAPRCMDVEGNYIYVTQYGGQVSKINIQDMTLESTFKGGDNLEGIVEEDGKLYVANSYKGINDFNQEVFVINAKTMALEKTLQVVLNPTKIHEIDDRIYLISQGNYVDIPGALQVLDTEKGTFIPILENVTKITEGDNGLVYGVCSTYDSNWQLTNSFFSYDPKRNKVSNGTFLQDAPSSFSTDAIYMLEVDEKTGFIYVGTSDYVNTGTIYQFNRAGKLIQSFDSGGINPSAMVFMD